MSLRGDVSLALSKFLTFFFPGMGVSLQVEPEVAWNLLLLSFLRSLPDTTSLLAAQLKLPCDSSVLFLNAFLTKTSAVFSGTFSSE